MQLRLHEKNPDLYPKSLISERVEEFLRAQQRIVDRYITDALLYTVPKYTITPDGCKCEWSIDLGPDFTDKPRLKDLYFKYIQPYETNAICKIELNNEKEKEKMNAKKCDRCGKLYELTSETAIKAFLCGRISEGEKETYKPEKVKEFNTYNIDVTVNSRDKIDMCPECRKKLKEFFESGGDETTVIKKAEE